MNFKNIFLISIILLAIFSISAISAEDVADIDNEADIVSADIESVDIVSADIISEESIIQVNSTDAGDNGTADENASDKNDTQSSIKSSDVVKYYKNDTQFEATFYDNEGNPLVKQAVNVNINGGNYTRTTNETGGIRFAINLAAGDYIIKCTNPVTNETVLNNVTVLPTISGNNVVKSYKNGTQYLINVVDGQGNPLKNTVVSLNINGVFYNRTTNENGTAKLNINLEPATYILTAINPVTTEQKSNTISVLNKIAAKNANSAGDVSIEYNSGGKFSVTLYEDNGTLAKNKTVTFNINGVFYNRTSDDKGVASLNINLAPGNYIITSEFEGCKASNTIKVRISPSIKMVSNSTLKVNDPFLFRLTEKNSGNPITGQHYGILYYNGTTYGAYPDSTGLVRFNLAIPAGSYLFYFGTIDDGYYSQILNGNTIKVED